MNGFRLTFVAALGLLSAGIALADNLRPTAPGEGVRLRLETPAHETLRSADAILTLTVDGLGPGETATIALADGRVIGGVTQFGLHAGSVSAAVPLPGDIARAERTLEILIIPDGAAGQARRTPLTASGQIVTTPR